MQVMLTNHSVVQFPVLVTKAGRWYAFMLQPGVEQTIAADDVTNLTMGDQIPGTSPADIDSARAKEFYLTGIAAMQGRYDATGNAAVVPLRLLVMNYEGTLTVDDGVGTVTVAKGEGKEVTGQQFMLTMS